MIFLTILKLSIVALVFRYLSESSASSNGSLNSAPELQPSHQLNYNNNYRYHHNNKNYQQGQQIEQQQHFRNSNSNYRGRGRHTGYNNRPYNNNHHYPSYHSNYDPNYDGSYYYQGPDGQHPRQYLQGNNSASSSRTDNNAPPNVISAPQAAVDTAGKQRKVISAAEEKSPNGTEVCSATAGVASKPRLTKRGGCDKPAVVDNREIITIYSDHAADEAVADGVSKSIGSTAESSGADVPGKKCEPVGSKILTPGSPTVVPCGYPSPTTKIRGSNVLDEPTSQTFPHSSQLQSYHQHVPPPPYRGAGSLPPPPGGFRYPPPSMGLPPATGAGFHHQNVRHQWRFNGPINAHRPFRAPFGGIRAGYGNHPNNGGGHPSGEHFLNNGHRFNNYNRYNGYHHHHNNNNNNNGYNNRKTYQYNNGGYQQHHNQQHQHHQQQQPAHQQHRGRYSSSDCSIATDSDIEDSNESGTG